MGCLVDAPQQLVDSKSRAHLRAMDSVEELQAVARRPVRSSRCLLPVAITKQSISTYGQRTKYLK